MAKHRATLTELLVPVKNRPYPEQVSYMEKRISKGELSPIVRGGTNGKKPALYLRYWVMEEEADPKPLQDELLLHTVPEISVDYYLHHLSTYEKERSDVRRLDAFLRNEKAALNTPLSLNERSFQIFGREKFLTQGGGRTLLSHCGLTESYLNVFHTAEPFASFAASRDLPQNALILENKDPFFGMRSHLLAGNRTIFGVPIGTLIYGAGKRVLSAFQDFSLSAEPYLLSPSCRLYYFGDLDWEGIQIYESLEEAFQKDTGREIAPFCPAYLAMLKKAKTVPSLPTTKEGQTPGDAGIFFSFFDPGAVQEMRQFLDASLYIPQEILNGGDYGHEL